MKNARSASCAFATASDSDTRDACLLTLGRLEEAERAWRTEILARQQAHRRLAETEAGVVAKPLVETPPRRRTQPFRNLFELVRRSVQPRRARAIA